MPTVTPVFDMEKAPQTEAELRQTADHLTAARKAKTLRATVVSVLLVVVAVVPLIILSQVAPNLLAGAGLVWAIVMLFVGLSLYSASEWALQALDAPLAELETVSPASDPHAYLALANWGKDDPVIRGYFQAVKAQGRLPVRGEIKAAEAWLDGAGDRELLVEANAAWQALSEQTLKEGDSHAK